MDRHAHRHTLQKGRENGNAPTTRGRAPGNKSRMIAQRSCALVVEREFASARGKRIARGACARPLRATRAAHTHTLHKKADGSHKRWVAVVSFMHRRRRPPRSPPVRPGRCSVRQAEICASAAAGGLRGDATRTVTRGGGGAWASSAVWGGLGVASSDAICWSGALRCHL